MNEIKIIGVIGAGQMGRGIAQVAASSDYQVVLFDAFEASLKKGFDFIKSQLDKGAEKGKWSADFAKAALARIKTVNSLTEFKDCDLIVEAATENKVIKFDIFKKIDEVAKPSAILASNTSSISITEIAATTKRPSKVVGMHFMNPVPVMKLIEGISGLETSDETFSAVAAVAKKMGKTFIKASDMPGFAVNRILMPYINEAVYTLHEGIASVADIDEAMKLGTNVPMGPLTLADFIGLDTCLAIMNVLHEGLGDTKYRPCPLLRNYVNAGRLGKKSGRGFYDYSSQQ
ncbi:MAG: 3-hydroxybutyryl-CoA dehydrogenase [Bdellovibrionales bacterium RIFOXYD12_FULL_39_22]|nr:MAG: 3-hydroxybutyryl-CoA dehydrogenase [Bdellovibrionales bacterium RIFOXYB1_FULL_39_21]OFZ41711.1 MAG: 3-hydroxybutyryl-CoA dehydrogenase [Bdellovibrionales bacterium RIFOXYC12_FULL_39_17]OFZ46111.1 MAG: 3-hydroxybutyryl-CoA dehydrogenase [Bdellovibrionales bacterium RIFOXYC1_FULL_39_130]OFZ74938.1 MAG: 3-hydroxybutyryl-CoA dehydrogenase [Bdellovibrionales bacterium RIFOXYD1_FULL_39_84]OFZ92791.1 MAG: 3-hydroxybutyryl-CoA dehydrogenase [Bdellovibrionales bacterium RIFOXYD12_FULL_39_22]HLE